MDTNTIIDVPRADALRYLDMVEELTPLVAIALGVEAAEVTRLRAALTAALSEGEVIIALYRLAPDGATSSVTLRVV